MRITIMLLTFLIVSLSAHGDTYQVPGDFPRIQMAINAVEEGSTILVSPGTYHERLNFAGKDLIVQSVAGPESTIIDMEGIINGSVVTFTMGETRDAVLDGFTLVNGKGTSLKNGTTRSMICGGGVLCSNASPTIRNNIIRNNRVDSRGGGIYIMLGNPGPLIENNSIVDNESESYGGGIYCEYSAEFTLMNNIISSNKTFFGGGVYAEECEAVIVGNVISENESNRYAGVYLKTCNPFRVEGNEMRGNNTLNTRGAMYCAHSEGLISGNTISENSGGGIQCEKSTVSILQNTVTENLNGGGITCTYQCDAHIEDNIVKWNMGNISHAGGIYGGPGISIIHNYVYGNTTARRGGGIRSNEAALIKDNFVAGNTSVEEGGGIFHSGSIIGAQLIEGNTIKNNTALSGGGVFCRQNTYFKNNTISDNHALKDGGGLCTEPESAVDVRYNIIKSNTADGYGGGIFLSETDAMIYRNEISGNEGAWSGGGIYCHGSVILDISDNEIMTNTTTGSGGGIYVENSQFGKVYFNRIGGNSAYRGGGIEHRSCSIPLIGVNQITDNDATEGAGVHFEQVTGGECVSNTFYGNIASSQGGGASCFDCSLVFSNAIFWNNQASIGPQISIGTGGGSSVIDIDHSDVQDGMNGVFVGGGTFNWNDGMIAAEPSFVSAASGDFHLLYTSPCRDTGNNDTLIASIDYEGDPRISSGIVDMGADEFHRHLYCIGDFTPQGAVQANILGEAGSSPVYLVFSGALLAEPLNLSIGTFYLDMPWILINLMSTVPPSGLLQLPGQLPRLPEAPYDLHMQALVAGKLTNLFTMEVR